MDGDLQPLLVLVPAQETSPAAELLMDRLAAVERFGAAPPLLERLQALGEDSVVVVVPELSQGEATVSRLLRQAPNCYIALLTAPDDPRTLAERFRTLPIDPHRIRLLPIAGDWLQALATYTAAVRRQSRHRRAVERAAGRVAVLNSQPLDWSAEELRRQVYEALPVGLIIIDTDGFIVDVNVQARSLLAVPPAEEMPLRPERIDSLIPGAERLEGERVMRVETGGEVRWLRIVASPLGGEAALGQVLTLEDVTLQEEQRRRLQAPAQAAEDPADSEDKADHLKYFVASLCHDLRTPLATAQLSSQLLRRRLGGTGAPAALASIEQVERALRRADALTHSLLDLSRAEAGTGIPIEPEPVKVDRFLEEAVEDLGTLYQKALLLQQPLPAVTARLDREGIRRLIDNLISNAVKHGAAQSPVRIGLRETGDSIEISVHNQGPAIPEQEQAHLFEPFYQSSARSARKVAGWGVGLAFVRAMAESHGGEVAVTSSEAEGTRFAVRLPKLPPPPITDSATASSSLH